MNAEDAIQKAKHKKRLAALLGNKSRTLDEANELVDMLVGYVVQHGASIIDMRDRMATQEGAIEVLSDMIAPKDQTLVGFDTPELILPPSPRKTN